MRFVRLQIAYANIKGLNEEPYLFEHRCFWAFSLMFENSTASMYCDNMPFIKMGNTEEEAKAFCDKIKENFRRADISENDEVILLFKKECDGRGHVLAIGKPKEDIWIDVDDNFKKKTYQELNIVPISLKVF